MQKNAEIKQLQAEMKSMVGVFKNSTEALKSRLITAKQKMKELQDEMKKTARKQVENSLKRDEQHTREVREELKRNNSRINSPWRTERQFDGGKKEIRDRNFLDLITETKIQEGQRVPVKTDSTRKTSRHTGSDSQQILSNETSPSRREGRDAVQLNKVTISATPLCC